ncbi:hypothetical protein Ancab_028290 [Ancistrocladus abbreviatus]
MAGHGGVIDHNKHWDGVVLPECQPNPSILRLNAHLSWEEAHEPLDAEDLSTLILTHGVCQHGQGVCGVVGLVPYAVGGTTVKEWAREHLYETTTRSWDEGR